MVQATRVFPQIESFPEQLENLSILLPTHGFTRRRSIGDDHFSRIFERP
jgi:hypothetical protein